MKRSPRVVFIFALMFSPVARGQEADVAAPVPEATLVAAGAGAFLPNTLTARVGSTASFAFAAGGYDLSRHGALADSAVEVKVWGPAALRAQASLSGDSSRMRPGLGGRVQLLRQAANGVDGSVTVLYKAEGFTEADGEIETVLAVGHRFDRVSLLGNLVYGQDPEGNERDGELRGAAFWSAGRWVLGVDSRARFAIGAQHGPASTVEPRFDIEGGPTAAAVLGPVAMFAEVGPSAFRLEGEKTRIGLAAIAGVGAGF
jgi:hypothetical protein